jgi:uncharacterized RDD family membrane protein YckC
LSQQASYEGGLPPELAPRTLRALAAFVDWLLLSIFPALGLLGALSWGAGTLSRALSSGDLRLTSGLGGGSDRAALLLVAGSAIATLLGVLYQWFGLAVRGQTLGKRLFGIQIVDDCGAPAGFFRALLLRVWVFGILAAIVQLLLQRAGGWIGLGLALANVLPIFGPRRRCLHDYLAGTQVRWADGSPLRAVPAILVFASMAAGLGVLALRAGVHEQLPQLRRTLEQPQALVPKDARPLLESIGNTLPASAKRVREPSFSAPKATQTIYQYEDAQGVVHFTEDLSQVPPEHRARVRTVR